MFTCNVLRQSLRAKAQPVAGRIVRYTYFGRIILFLLQFWQNNILLSCKLQHCNGQITTWLLGVWLMIDTLFKPKSVLTNTDFNHKLISDKLMST